MPSIAGKLLVASRKLRDPNFARSVVLMIEHSLEGALGLILNRPSPNTVAALWESIGEPHLANDQLVYLGGPVPGPLIVLHTSQELGEKPVLPGLFMSVQKDVIEQIVRTPEIPHRLYSGHSGWGANQLEAELEAGGWVVGPALLEDPLAPDSQVGQLWDRVLHRISLSIMLPGIPPDRLPPESNWN